MVNVTELTRPDRKLLYSYLLHSLLWGPAFFIPLFLNLIRYRTLRYQFDDDGLTVMWGRLARREVTVSYHSIQDIHLQSDLVERWLGLARIEVQTASADARAEVTLEGILEFETVRDYLFTQMQAARLDQVGPGPAEPADLGALAADAGLAGLTDTLNEVAAELRALRLALATDRPDDLNRAPEKSDE